MALPRVDTPVEYGLYALATRCPDLFASAERFAGGMLAEDQDALRRVKALTAASSEEQWSEIVGEKAASEDRLLGRAERAEAAARELYAHLSELVTWGHGSDAPDDARRDWRSATGALMRHGELAGERG